MAGPPLPGAWRGSEASVPPELALGQQPWGYRSQISPVFPIKDADWGKLAQSAA